MTDALEPLKGLFHRVRGSVSRRRLADGSGLRIVREPQNAEIEFVAMAHPATKTSLLTMTIASSPSMALVERASGPG